MHDAHNVGLEIASANSSFNDLIMLCDCKLDSGKFENADVKCPFLIFPN